MSTSTAIKTSFNMNITFMIFLLAISIRIIYIVSQGNDLEEKLIEDELLYWTWSLRGAYTSAGDLGERLLAERMPGAFYYYQFLMYAMEKNIKYILYFQALIDSITCYIIALSTSKLFTKDYLKVFLFAAISPLMIIMSSQTLAETLFLFLFSLFILFSLRSIYSQKIFLNMLLSGFFLGLTTFVKTITFPLIFLLLLPFFIIHLKKNHTILKIIVSLLLFLTAALAPITERLKNNIQQYNTFSLTSQVGTHLAYWVTPTILCYIKNINREDAINIVNTEVEKKISKEMNFYEESKILTNISFSFLKEIKYLDLVYIWSRASLLNLITPSILLDKKVRNLPHPSFYSVSEPLEWLNKLFINSNYYNYLFIIFIASFASLFVLLSLFLGPIFLFKKDKFICIVTIVYIMYFLLITGPVLSPKYIVPLLPCLFLYQAITLSKLLEWKDFLLSKK